jgi:Asp-tRNA(Asn)/Glu-tRNA(Gln) amidotransferase A subunit family amidase
MKSSHLLPISDLNLLAASSTGRETLVTSFCESSSVDKFEVWVGALKGSEPIHRELQQTGGRKLSGLLIGIKDIFASKEFPTTMGTENVWPTSSLKFDARVIDKLKFEGAIVVGKTSTSELAVHASNSTRNPRYEGRVAGTSSTGSAAAVAAGHVPITLATQTAGSIARPSSYCGVIGFKPSFGTLPRTGILKTTDEFDSVGLIGHRVADIEATFDAIRISGPDHPIHNMEKTDFKFDKLIQMYGADFDRASSFLCSQMNDYVSTIANRTNLRLETLI